MKTIGLIGGTGWVSTVEYYRIINEEGNRRLGAMNFPKIILYSVNFGEYDRLTSAGDLKGAMNLISDAAVKVEGAGAEMLLLCANTPHRFAEEIEKAVSMPLIHIAEETAKEIKRLNLNKIGLLGTRQTMELDFYRKRLYNNGIETLVPEEDERGFIQSTISDELLRNIFRRESKERFLAIIRRLADRGAQGIVLGCTEIPLLVKQEDISIPLFNTLEIHSLAAVRFSLGEI